jgi:hypothetical protein
MKTLISASILTLSLLAGSAQAADVSTVFGDLNATAPRSTVFDDINATAPRSGIFEDLRNTAPRSGVFSDLQNTAPRSDGVYGTLETSAP